MDSWFLALTALSLFMILYYVYLAGVKRSLEQFPQAAFVIDKNNKILYSNKKAAEIYLTIVEGGELPGSAISSLSASIMKKKLQEGTCCQSEFRYLGRDCLLVLVQLEHKDDKSTIHSDLNLVHTMIQATPDAIGVMDHDLVYRACNQAFVEPLGIERPDLLLGRRLEDVASQEIYEKFAPSDRKVLNSGEAFFIVDEVRDNDGNPQWIDARKFRFINPYTSKPGLFIFARDITEVELTKKALNETRDNYKKLSMIDALTQIGNRRLFNDHLTAEWKNHIRNNLPFSLIMCDIDKFKKLNDTYGHVYGDEVLVSVANALSQPLKRPLDRVYRYGGEEFVFILCNTDSYGATTVAERIHKAIASLKFEHYENNPEELLTVSLGVYTCFPSASKDPLDIVQAVDEALYKAKNQGRNQTIYAGKWYKSQSAETALSLTDS